MRRLKQRGRGMSSQAPPVNENIAEVLIRAEVLLQPPNNFSNRGSPSRHGIIPFALAEGDRPGDAFLQLIRASDSLDDVLPLRGQSHEDSLILLSLDESEEDPNRPGFLEPLLVQRQGLPPPSFTTVPELLADPQA